MRLQIIRWIFFKNNRLDHVAAPQENYEFVDGEPGIFIHYFLGKNCCIFVALHLFMRNVQPFWVQEQDMAISIEKHDCLASFQYFEIDISLILFAENLFQVVF